VLETDCTRGCVIAAELHVRSARFVLKANRVLITRFKHPRVPSPRAQYNPRLLLSARTYASTTICDARARSSQEQRTLRWRHRGTLVRRATIATRITVLLTTGLGARHGRTRPADSIFVAAGPWPRDAFKAAEVLGGKRAPLLTAAASLPTCRGLGPLERWISPHVGLQILARAHDAANGPCTAADGTLYTTAATSSLAHAA